VSSFMGQSHSSYGASHPSHHLLHTNQLPTVEALKPLLELRADCDTWWNY